MSQRRSLSQNRFLSEMPLPLGIAIEVQKLNTTFTVYDVRGQTTGVAHQLALLTFPLLKYIDNKVQTIC